MSGFNLSALAVRERALTLFLLIAIAGAGAYAFTKLGRAEDPTYTVKVLTVTAFWPGATTTELQDQVADRLEKRLQELAYYDRTETVVRPGLMLIKLYLKDSMPPSAVPEQFYQARKKLYDEATYLPRGVIGPLVNDEYSDVYFALYALQAPGMPHRELVLQAEELRQRLLHVPGVEKINILGEQPQKVFVEVSYQRLATLGITAQALFAALATLGLVGAVPTLLLFHQPFGFNAILGLIGLAGILMRNTLILVDQIHHDREAGLSLYDAIVESTVRRARPVVLTALAAMLAFIPLTFSTFWGSLAYVLIGGIGLGTVLTLLFLPALYAIWFRVPHAVRMTPTVPEVESGLVTPI